ncbi:UvrB/UvrC motif-containing protein [Virgibacillus kekensis]|uniref:UvrB/UvrC motif-containing protein n=1 Tax=Virgibacillus kekensis TaxID=202261 RepID=A0ABV9DMQ5_9BACI
MECQECHKRPATVHFTQVINGNKREVHVCEVCSKEKGYMSYPEEGFAFHNLLSGLFNFDASSVEGKQASGSYQQTQELQCSHCGMTYSAFKRAGKFGCAECYRTFSNRLDPIFRRVHSGNTKHQGRIPARKGGDLHLKKQVETYKSKLQRLIENEEFEEAAKVRDEIKKLDKEMRGEDK